MRCQAVRGYQVKGYGDGSLPVGFRSRGVVVNFDLGNGFRDLGPSNGGARDPAHGV